MTSTPAQPSPGIDWQVLVRAAENVRSHAHAPYSGYAVGAAVLGASGRVYAGCNVENASYPLSICAERAAVAQMVAAGDERAVALAVVTRGPAAAAPCGACRQTLAEFAVDLPVHLSVAGGGPARLTTLAELLPDAFRSEALLPRERQR